MHPEAVEKPAGPSPVAIAGPANSARKIAAWSKDRKGALKARLLARDLAEARDAADEIDHIVLDVLVRDKEETAEVGHMICQA